MLAESKQASAPTHPKHATTLPTTFAFAPIAFIVMDHIRIVTRSVFIGIYCPFEIYVKWCCIT